MRREKKWWLCFHRTRAATAFWSQNPYTSLIYVCSSLLTHCLRCVLHAVTMYSSLCGWEAFSWKPIRIVRSRNGKCAPKNRFPVAVSPNVPGWLLFIMHQHVAASAIMPPVCAITHFSPRKIMHNKSEWWKPWHHEIAWWVLSWRDVWTFSARIKVRRNCLAIHISV